MLSDNTEIEMPRRKSWWKKVENSRDMIEVLENEKPTNPVNLLEEFDMEVLTQEKNDEEKKNYIIDLPESSDNESINSIVLPQRKLFIQKENMPQKKFEEVVNTSKDNKTNIEDKTINVSTKNLFGKTSQRTKPVFPSVLLNISPDQTLANKTKELLAEAKGQAKSLFGRPGTKRKNIFAEFIVSESEDEILEIQPKRFTFRKPSEPSRRSSNASSVTTDIDMDDWKLLPSSTMVENQLEAQLITPGKKARLSKLSEAKESTNTDSTKQSDKSMNYKNKSKFLSLAKYHEVEKSVSDMQNSPTKNDLEITAPRKQIATLNKSTTIFNNSKNIPEAQEIPVNEETKEKSTVNKSYNINKTNQPPKSQIVENNQEDILNVQQPDKITQKEIVESELAIDQQEKDEEIALTYEDNDPEDKEDNNDVAKHLIDNKTKTICADNRLSKASEYMDNIEKELSRIVGAETNHILQIETPMPNKSIQLIKKVVEETLDSQFEGHGSRNNTTKSFENNQKDDAKEDNEQKVEEITVKDQAIAKDINNQVAEKVINQDQADVMVVNNAETEKIKNKDQTNSKDDSNKETEGIINKDQTDAMHDNNQEAEEEIDEDQADENDDNNQEAEEELDETEASQEVEASDQEGTEAEQSQEMENNVEIIESNNQEEIEASHDAEIVNNDETNAEAEEKDEEAEDDELGASDDEVQASNDEGPASEDEIQNESLEIEEANQNDSNDQDEENQNESDDQHEEQIESQQIEEDDDEQQNSQEMVDDEDRGESRETENEIEGNDSQEMEIDNSEEVQEEADDETVQQEIKPQQSAEEIHGNVTHDTTGRNRKKRETNTPEAILQNASNEMDSFANKGRNTSIRKTKSILKNFTIRPSIVPPRESSGFSEGTKNSSAEGSGWDSHRTTRKTLRQTFGKDFTPRKSLRALVMEKSARRHRQTQAELELRLHQANSTELTNEQSEMEYEEAVSDHEILKQTRQATLETYLQKIKKENMEFKDKIEQQVRNSLKSNPGRVDILNFRPNKPSIRRAKSLQTAPKVKRIKSSVIYLQNLPPELVEDMKYKPPKRFKPGNAAWITKRLYKFLESKLEPKYDYRARIRAEKLVETLYNFVRDIRRVRVAPPHSVAELKREMARLDIVSTHFEFYNFFSDYLPKEVNIKVVPDIVNAIPLPREGVFAAIAV